MTNIDITGYIGPLDKKCEPMWPMYSFDRPSFIVWNKIAEELSDAGWSENDIKEWLQSKHSRWALDDALGMMLSEAAECFAQGMIKYRRSKK